MQDMNDENMQVVSIVIRVKNAAEELSQCLGIIKQQVVPAGVHLEIVVVDNASTDGSDVVARFNDTAVINISREQFSWGRALNRGIAAAKGDVVILLSSDAQPAEPSWLCEMLGPFTESNVAAVYGRQIPYKNATVDERVRLKRFFVPEGKRYDKNSCRVNSVGRGLIASNACAAIRRTVWEQMPYDESIEAGEEGPWSYNVIEQGYTIVYEPLAKVYHSHRDGAFKLAWRHLELLKKNLSFMGASLTGIRILRWVACFVKRRLINCFQPDIPFLARIEGLTSLPIEIVAFIIVGFCPEKFYMKLKCRRLFWG